MMSLRCIDDCNFLKITKATQLNPEPIYDCIYHEVFLRYDKKAPFRCKKCLEEEADWALKETMKGIFDVKNLTKR